jgi:hypothetical protein
VDSLGLGKWIHKRTGRGFHPGTAFRIQKRVSDEPTLHGLYKMTQDSPMRVPSTWIDSLPGWPPEKLLIFVALAGIVLWGISGSWE